MNFDVFSVLGLHQIMAHLGVKALNIAPQIPLPYGSCVGGGENGVVNKYPVCYTEYSLVSGTNSPCDPKVIKHFDAYMNHTMILLLPSTKNYICSLFLDFPRNILPVCTTTNFKN